MERRDKGFADGGSVPRVSSSPGSPGVSGAIKDALAALKDYMIDRPRREIQAGREQRENAVIDDTVEHASIANPPSTDYAHGGIVQHFAKGGSVRKKVPVRVVVEWPRDKDGAYLQPKTNSAELEKVMNHNRMRAANQFDLADTHGFGNSHTYDPLGNYECFTCNQYVHGANDCMAIEDIVAGPDGDIQAGSSCRHYEETCAGDPETPLKRTTKAAALFGTAANRKGFGCKRCGWRRDSLWIDSLGRDVWCGAMYFTTEPNVCCAVNSAKTLPDGTPITKVH